MSRLVCSTTFIMGILLATTQPLLAQNTKSNQLLIDANKYQRIIKERVELKESYGIVVGLISPRGKKFISYGTMGAKSKDKVNQDTLFEINSITKTFTSLLVARFVERKELTWNTSLQKIIPKKEVRLPLSPKGLNLAMKHLLTHTGSLPKLPTKSPDNPYKGYTKKEIYKFLSGFKSIDKPIGQKFLYSQLGFALIADALEHKANKDFELLLKKEITSILNMPDTVLTLNAQQKKRLASAHKGGKPVAHWDWSALSGAGGVYSTAKDLTTFIETQMNLKPSSLSKTMALTHKTRLKIHGNRNKGLNMALGWFITREKGQNVIWHNSLMGGHRAFIGFDKKKKKGIVILSNSDSSISDIAFHYLLPNYPLRQIVKKVS